MTKDEALRLALEALENSEPNKRRGDDDYREIGWMEHREAITAIKAALEAKDEPVQNQLMALIDENQRLRAELKFNTTPPQRKPLTDEEIQDALEAEFLGSDLKRNWQDDLRVARAIEAAHGIKGEA